MNLIALTLSCPRLSLSCLVPQIFGPKLSITYNFSNQLEQKCQLIAIKVKVKVIMDSDMIIRQVLLRQTWCLILGLVSVWGSPLCVMFVCSLLSSATAVFNPLETGDWKFYQSLGLSTF